MDRNAAGRLLAGALRHLSEASPIVYGLPRGGVPVAAEVAKALKAPLDIILVRKLGVPGQPELAFGAVIDGERPETILNTGVVRAAGLSEAEIDAVGARELAEIERRRALYFKDQERPDPHGRTVIVVDDGLATGATARAALRALRRARPAHIVLAVPVAPPETVKEMRAEADELVCLTVPGNFRSVGSAYEDFPQLEDSDVLHILETLSDRQPGDTGRR